MKRCEECKKSLGFVEGYRHPIRGKDFLLCSSCFDAINESVVKWREANLPYVGFFKNGSSKRNHFLNLEKNEKRYPHRSRLYNNIWPFQKLQNNVE